MRTRYSPGSGLLVFQFNFLEPSGHMFGRPRRASPHDEEDEQREAPDEHRGEYHSSSSATSTLVGFPVDRIANLAVVEDLGFVRYFSPISEYERAPFEILCHLLTDLVDYHAVFTV